MAKEGYAPWMEEHRPGSDFRFFGYDPVKQILEWARPDENGNVVVCTQHLVTGDLLDLNRKAEAESAGQRFGDGKIVASVPEHIFYNSGLAQAVREKDKAWVSRFLNDPDHAAFRTFRGRV